MILLWQHPPAGPVVAYAEGARGVWRITRRGRGQGTRFVIDERSDDALLTLIRDARPHDSEYAAKRACQEAEDAAGGDSDVT
jgi:hypothetical protein